MSNYNLQHFVQMGVAFGTAAGSLKQSPPHTPRAVNYTENERGPCKQLLLCCIFVTYLPNGNGGYKYAINLASFFFITLFCLKCVNNELRIVWEHIAWWLIKSKSISISN